MLGLCIASTIIYLLVIVLDLTHSINGMSPADTSGSAFAVALIITILIDAVPLITIWLLYSKTL